jgi:tRNA-intron lyase
MFTAEIADNKVIVREPEAIKELHETVWYGKPVNGKLELELIEACLLCERAKIEIMIKGRKLEFKDFYHLCCKIDPRFVPRYAVYHDLRERGLPVRIGFKGCDFRVYERGAKPAAAPAVKWIVFVASEDYVCALRQLGKAMRLAENIRAMALWAVVDNDLDCTYYILKRLVEL